MRTRGTSGLGRFAIAAALFWAATLLAGGCDQFNHCSPGSFCYDGGVPPYTCYYVDYYNDFGDVTSGFVRSNDPGALYIHECNEILDFSRATSGDCS